MDHLVEEDSYYGKMPWRWRGRDEASREAARRELLSGTSLSCSGYAYGQYCAVACHRWMNGRGIYHSNRSSIWAYQSDDEQLPEKYSNIYGRSHHLLPNDYSRTLLAYSGNHRWCAKNHPRTPSRSYGDSLHVRLVPSYEGGNADQHPHHRHRTS